MSKVKKLHNKTLYRVELDVTLRHVIYIDAVSLNRLDDEVKRVVDDDMYSIATECKPKVVSYDYSSQYISCEQSFEDFVNEQLD